MVEAKTILNELHIDETPEELALIKSLIQQATAMIVESISSIEAVDVNYIDNTHHEVFERLVITLVTSLYYDRDLTEGYSKGFLIMINQLKNKVLMEVVDESQSNEGEATI